MPVIYDNQGLEIGYGGSRQWYTDGYAREYGESCVVATNVIAYYLKAENKWSYDEFYDLMNHMYTLIQPDEKNLPYIYKYSLVVQEVLQEKAVDYQLESIPVYIGKSRNIETVFKEVKKAIDDGYLVAMLTLNRVRSVESYCTWICISGYKENRRGYDIIYSKDGQRIEEDIESLFKPIFMQLCRFVYFKIEKKDPTRKQDLQDE